MADKTGKLTIHTYRQLTDDERVVVVALAEHLGSGQFFAVFTRPPEADE